VEDDQHCAWEEALVWPARVALLTRRPRTTLCPGARQDSVPFLPAGRDGPSALRVATVDRASSRLRRTARRRGARPGRQPGRREPKARSAAPASVSCDASLLRTSRLVRCWDNGASRTHPAGGRRTLPLLSRSWIQTDYLVSPERPAVSCGAAQWPTNLIWSWEGPEAAKRQASTPASTESPGNRQRCPRGEQQANAQQPEPDPEHRVELGADAQLG
jgi:hypothetical protein